MASVPAKGFGQLNAADILIGELPLGQLVPIVNQSPNPPGKIANVTMGVTDLQLNRTVDGATYIVMNLQDPFRTFLNSGMLAFADVMTFDGLNFSMVSWSKQGDQLQLTFEAALVYDLRLQSGSYTWESTTDLQGFVKYLLAGGPNGKNTGGKLIADPGPVSFDTGSGATASSTVSSTTPIARGTTAAPNEDSWTCMNRLADSAGWRIFEMEGTIYLGSDAWLLSQFPSGGTLQEFTPLVQNMDGTYDIGMPLGQVTVTAMNELWPYHPGQPVTLVRMGPLNGLWMVYSMQRDLFSPQGQMTLQKSMTPEQVRLGAPQLQYV